VDDARDEEWVAPRTVADMTTPSAVPAMDCETRTAISACCRVPFYGGPAVNPDLVRAPP